MPTITTLKKILNKNNISIKNMNMKEIKKGYNVELEHGNKNPKTNVTNDDVEMTLKIVMAHMSENSDYYKYYNGKGKEYLISM